MLGAPPSLDVYTFGASAFDTVPRLAHFIATSILNMVAVMAVVVCLSKSASWARKCGGQKNCRQVFIRSYFDSKFAIDPLFKKLYLLSGENRNGSVFT